MYLLLDKAQICKTEKMVANHVAHPYTCSMFITCDGDTFVHESYVYNYQTGVVYNPQSGQSDYLSNVACASKEIGKPK